MSKDWRYLEFTTPFTSEGFGEATTNSDFVIRGKAINATTTRNGNIYSVEELRNNGGSLMGKPILVDHINSVDKIAGRVRQAQYSEMDGALMFEGVIKDKRYQEMISEGLINNVSVGATVDDVEELYNEETGKTTYALKGIEFLEVSLVAIPADPGAGFSKSSFEAVVSEALKMKKESQIPLAKDATPVAEQNTMETQEAIKTVTSEEVAALAETVKTLLAEIAELKTKKEEIVAPAVVAEKVDDTKGVVAAATEESTETTDAFVLEKNGRFYDLTKNVSQLARFRRDY